MTLIKSISGIRGTIGGVPGDNLTPMDIVECTAAYGQIVKEKKIGNKIVIGRDGRITGEMVSSIVVNTLIAMGFEVVDLGLSTTPTVEIAVEAERASAGIIITASHNPKQWNALKFLNEKGEFISPETGEKILNYIENKKYSFSHINDLGSVVNSNKYIDYHIKKILSLPFVNEDAIRNRKFKVVVDCINSTGAISVLPLLKKMGCEVIAINDEITGDFAHNPEPLPQHLTDLSNKVIESKADMGISVDPDVDRLAFVCENGEMFGEEYTLVAAADIILSKKHGNVVSNLSSSRALGDIAKRYNCDYYPSKVGEVNVVAKMKEVNAVIGGEGNGGVILPYLHYGRDSLVGIALVLSLLAERKVSLCELKSSYPDYSIVKNKIELTSDL
ncbi:MAG TPA: phosphoglucosamine mutase, partial [Bacteroidetes bacterium]|nr:phosphoglucosamine mutase [Bacteroidota bacterium]